MNEYAWEFIRLTRNTLCSMCPFSLFRTGVASATVGFAASLPFSPYPLSKLAWPVRVATWYRPSAIIAPVRCPMDT